MAPRPQTIQIFLPGGDPRGIRVAEITTRIIQAIEVPRKLLPEFLKMDESQQVGLYFLFGRSEDDGKDQVYIGQSGDLRTRLTDHNKKIDFWERALVVISRTQNLTQTHTTYLEWQSIQLAREIGRYQGENGTAGTKPHTPAPLEADCVEVFETAGTLLSTLGFPIFEPLIRTAVANEAGELFFCTTSGINGKGQYTEEGFVVLKGSVGRSQMRDSLKKHNYKARWEEVVNSDDCKIEGDNVIFIRDRLFTNPSLAATVLLGRPSNGWMEWKDKDGRTLDELKRQTNGDDGA